MERDGEGWKGMGRGWKEWGRMEKNGEGWGEIEEDQFTRETDWRQRMLVSSSQSDRAIGTCLIQYQKLSKPSMW